MSFTKETISVPAKVGGMSLIGVGPLRPTSWGNYFWLASGERVLNFWAENLTAAVEQFLPDGMVTIVKYTWVAKAYGDPLKMVTNTACIIQDERIPPEWYYNKLCSTGGTRPSAEVAQDIFAILGDPYNESEQYTDPVSYYAKRGGLYRDGCVSYAVKVAEVPTVATGLSLSDAMVTVFEDGKPLYDQDFSTLRNRTKEELHTGTYFAPYIPKDMP